MGRFREVLEDNDLSPCPMCGKTDSVRLLKANFTYYDNYKVVCSIFFHGCGASGGYARTAEAAKAAWNTRAVVSRVKEPRENTPRANESAQKPTFMQSCDHEPAETKNTPQNGLECADTFAGMRAEAVSIASAYTTNEREFRKLAKDICGLLDQEAKRTEKRMRESEAFRMGITRDCIEHREPVEIFGVEYVSAESSRWRIAKLEREIVKLRDVIEKARKLLGSGE